MPESRLYRKERKFSQGIMKKRYWIPLLIVTFIIILWFALPTLITNYVNDVLADIDGYRGSVTHVDLNLFQGAYAVDSLVIDKLEGDERYPFVAVEQINLSLEWGALFKGRIVGDVEVLSPDIHLMAETDETEAQFGNDVDWTEPIKELMIIQIDRFTVRDGTIHYLDLGSDPQVDLPLRNLQLEISNISNVEERAEEMPSRIEMSATSIGGGNMSLQAEANLLKQIPDFDLSLEFEGVNLPDLNDFFEAYAGVDAEEGEFSLYSEIAVQDGNIEGYVQPVILNLSVLNLEDDQDFFSAAWEVIVAGVTEVFTNQEEDQLATRVPLRGELDSPDTDVFLTVWNVFRNAFIEAFQQAVEGVIEFEDAEEEDG